jgi:hypothetical protein
MQKKSRTPASVLNELFSQKIETCEGKERIEEYGGDYIRRRLMEVSFARKIIPPTYVRRPGRLRRAWWWILRKLGLRKRPVKCDTLVKIVDVEPQSKAMAITFRGQPTKAFKRGEANVERENE